MQDGQLGVPPDGKQNLRATLVELHFLILELHFLIIRTSDSGGEQVRINSEVIPVANEWGAVGSGGEWVFFSSQLVV